MRVVIAEDDALLREGLSLLLKTSGIEVAAAVDNAEDFLAFVENDRPDAVVMDVRMPPTHTDEGLRAAVRAREIHPGLPVLVLSAHVETSYAVELLADGVGGGRLPAQGAGRQGRAVPRRAPAGRQGRHGDGPRGDRPADVPPPGRGSAGGVDRAGA